METYILILLAVLVALVIVMVFFGFRQLNHLRMVVNSNTMNISALQSLIANTDILNRKIQEEVNLEKDTELSSDGNITNSDDEESSNDEEQLDKLITEVKEDNIKTIIEKKEEVKEEVPKELPKEEVKEVPKEDVKTGITIECDDDTVDDTTKTIELSSGNNKKKTFPTELAKNHEIGYTMVSDNDGKKYEVVANKNGSKRWKLVVEIEK